MYKVGKEIRQKIFYDVLVNLAKQNPDEWWDKTTLTGHTYFEHWNQSGLNADLYEINASPTAHDECVMMNIDRLEINKNLEYEKIILIKDNKFKIATLEETIAEEKKITKAALLQLYRGSVIRAKRTRDKQMLLLTEDEMETAEMSNEQMLKVIETFMSEPVSTPTPNE